MPNSILVIYATRYGSTRKVAEVVAATLQGYGYAVDIQPIRDVKTISGYNAIILGAALYMYHWHKDARRFLSKHRKMLLEKPVAIFALGPTHDPYDEKEWQDSHAQLDKALKKYTWLKPLSRKMFGGAFDPKKLHFPINVLAGAEPASDIRNWTAIRSWASKLAAQFDNTQ